MGNLKYIFYLIDAYFIFYQIPKMARRFAKEQKRSALGWGLIGIVMWIVMEFAVGFSIGLVYGIGTSLWGWSKNPPFIFFPLVNIASLIAALISLLLFRLILNMMAKDTASDVSPPPPPPQF
jgi:hypothetical protein